MLCIVIDMTINIRQSKKPRAKAASVAVAAASDAIRRVNDNNADQTVVLRAQSEAVSKCAREAMAELRRTVERQREYFGSIRLNNRDWRARQRGFATRWSNRPVSQLQPYGPPAPDGDR